MVITTDLRPQVPPWGAGHGQRGWNGQRPQDDPLSVTGFMAVHQGGAARSDELLERGSVGGVMREACDQCVVWPVGRHEAGCCVQARSGGGWSVIRLAPHGFRAIRKQPVGLWR